MSRLTLIVFGAVLCLAGAPDEHKDKKDKPDISQMPAEIHAPLFRAPQPPQAGAVTERLTASLPKSSSSPVVHRNFIDDRIFGKMERDKIPHAPLATDAEFFRRVTLDLTGRIPLPADLRDFLADCIFLTGAAY